MTPRPLVWRNEIDPPSMAIDDSSRRILTMITACFTVMDSDGLRSFNRRPFRCVVMPCQKCQPGPLQAGVGSSDGSARAGSPIQIHAQPKCSTVPCSSPGFGRGLRRRQRVQDAAVAVRPQHLADDDVVALQPLGLPLLRDEVLRMLDELPQGVERLPVVDGGDQARRRVLPRFFAQVAGDGAGGLGDGLVEGGRRRRTGAWRT